MFYIHSNVRKRLFLTYTLQKGCLFIVRETGANSRSYFPSLLPRLRFSYRVSSGIKQSYTINTGINRYSGMFFLAKYRKLNRAADPNPDSRGSGTFLPPGSG